MKGAGRFLLVAATLAAASPARSEVNWQSSAVLGEAAFCGAVFRVREMLATRWRGHGTAVLDIASRKGLVAFYNARTEVMETCGGDGSGLRFQDTYRSCSADLDPHIEKELPRVAWLYVQMGMVGEFPPTCMEDPACVSCRDFLQSMQD